MALRDFGARLLRGQLREVTGVNVFFVAVLLAVLILVTYVPVTGMGLVDLFYH
jgi:hypothetical protein